MSQVQIKTFFVALAFLACLNFFFIAKLENTPCKETPKLRRFPSLGALNITQKGFQRKESPKGVPKKETPKGVPKKESPKKKPKYLEVISGSHYFKLLKNDSIFVKTGDIPDMWIRDSTAQVWPLRSHVSLIEKVLNMQSFFILQDPYANSYRDHKVKSPTRSASRLGRKGWVATRNYELDSGCYFIRLLHYAWSHNNLEIEKYKTTIQLLIDTWIIEQNHEEKSPYRYAELPRNGLGSPVAWTGLTWTGFRPSDDPHKYGYHIPSNLFAVKVLGYVLEMFPELVRVRKLREEILSGVNNYGIWKDAQNNKHYCYEVDGLGGCNKMDDANVPSLLSIPYIDPEGYDRVIWQNTYKWIWSSKNPYFYKGSFAEGIGSPHTPKGYIWPMSLVIRAIVDPSVSKEMRAKIEESKVRGKLHESFYKDDPRRLTREDFNWPNELYKELVVSDREPVNPAHPVTISIQI